MPAFHVTLQGSSSYSAPASLGSRRFYKGRTETLGDGALLDWCRLKGGSVFDIRPATTPAPAAPPSPPPGRPLPRTADGKPVAPVVTPAAVSAPPLAAAKPLPGDVPLAGKAAQPVSANKPDAAVKAAPPAKSGSPARQKS